MTTLARIEDSAQKDFLVSSLNEQRQDGEFCDVLLKVSGQTLPTHGCVLSARSPVFRDLIRTDRPLSPHLTGLPQEIHVELPELKEGGDWLPAMLDLLNYIYTGEITLVTDTVDLVLKLAEAFRLKALLALVRTHAKRQSRTTAECVGSSGCFGRISGGDATATDEASVEVPDASSLRSSDRSTDAPAASSSEVSPELAQPPATARVSSAGRQRRTRAPAGGTGGGGPPAPSAKRTKKAESRRDITFVCQRWGCGFKTRDARAIILHKRQHPTCQAFKCLACGLYSRRAVDMVEHLREANHAETDCSLCGSETHDRGAFLEHIAKHADPIRPYFCWICLMQTRNRTKLEEHMVVHASDRPFVCDECPRGFKWKSSLEAHKRAHAQVRSYMCDQCDFSSVHIQNLRHHLRMHRLPPLCCQHCSYQTHCKYRLKNHEVRHAETKPFVCDVCGVRFKGRAALTVHTKTFHDPDGPKLRCTLCDFFTARKEKLQMHCRKHHGGLGMEISNALPVIAALVPH